MIEIELNCELNAEINGKRRFNKNLVYFGSDYSCDIFTPGNHIKPLHGFIEIVGTKLLVHLGDGVDHIHVDGKLTTSVRYLKVGQLIKFGDYELKVSNFMENHYPSSRETVNKITDEIIKAGGKELEILKSIQEYE